MNITETSINSGQVEIGDGGPGGLLALNNDTLHVVLQAEAAQVKLTSATVGATPVGVPFEIAASALKLTGLGTVATPTGTLEPTWVKVTVNGVAGVIPFYPL